MPKQYNFAFIFVFLLITINFFYGLGTYPLADNNEGLYAEIAREMLQTKQWIIPHLNGVPYLEKPPLLYWLIALCFKLGGINAWMARLIPALSASITILLPFILSASLTIRTCWLAAVLLASSFGFIVIGHVVFFDMLLTLWFSLCLYGFYMWYVTERIWFLRFSYASLGLAVMTKGLVALALLPSIMLITMLWNRCSLKRVIQLFDGIGIGLFLLIVLPWHIAATLQDNHFAWQYFVNEHWLRFLNQRIPHDYYSGPWYYHIARLLILFLPWSLLVPILLKKSTTSSLNVVQWQRLLWTWLLLPLLFFSCSAAKANYYMVISLPALANLLALRLSELEISKKGVVLVSIVAGLSAVLVIALIIIAKDKPDRFSSNIIAEQLSDPTVVIYMYQDYENYSSIAFYSPKHLQIIDSQSSDLYYAKQRAYPGFITLSDFKRDCGHHPCYLIVAKDKWAGLQKQLNTLKFKELTKTQRVMLLYKP